MPSLSDRDLYRYRETLHWPQYCKEAEFADVRPAEPLARHLYADQARQEFPVHTAAATWFSHVKFAEVSQEFDARRRNLIAYQLNKAARFFKIEHDCQDIVPRETKAASDRFTVTIAGHEIVLTAPEEVKAAASYVLRYRDRFTFPDRQKFAQAVIYRAGQLGVELDETGDALDKVAGYGAGNVDEIRQLMNSYAWATEQSRESPAGYLRAIAKHVDHAMPAERREKLASILDDVAHRHGLYDREHPVPFPEDVLYRVTEKVARTFRDDHIALPGGRLYRVADIVDIPASELEARIGPDFAAQVAPHGLVDREKFAAAVMTVSGLYARGLEQALAGCGVLPIDDTGRSARKYDLAGLLELAGQA